MKHYNILAILVMIMVSSCHNEITFDISKEPVMELYGDVLYAEEIEEAMPDGISGIDSANFIQQYKEKWAVDRLLYNKAINNISNLDEINALTESYRKELIINEYLNKLTTKQLKPVSEDSLAQFYQKHKENFILTEPIAKGILIKVATTAPDQNKLSKWLNDINDENLDNIMHYCTKNATYFQLFMDNWVLFNKVSEQLDKPIEPTTPKLKEEVVIQKITDFNYYLKITGLYLAGDPQPFELVEKDIQNILSTKEKIDYIHRLHSTLYEKALEKGTITLYNNDEE